MTDNVEELQKMVCELQKEIEEDEGIIEDAYNKMQELQVVAAIASKSSGGKIKKKQAVEYEEHIEELEKTLSLFSVAEIGMKANEIENYLKAVIKLKEKVGKALRVGNPAELAGIENEISKLSATMIKKHLQLSTIVNALTDIEGLSRDEIFERLIDVDALMPSIINILLGYENQLIRKDKEILELKESLSAFSDGITYQKLKESIESKELAISGYRDKVAGLEFELKKSSKS